MSHIPRSNLVAANRTVPSGNTITLTTTKQYFASKHTITAGGALGTEVWQLRAFGYYSSALIAPGWTLRLEANRSIILATTSTLLPSISITKEQWNLEAWLTCTGGGTGGGIMVNGMAGIAPTLGGDIKMKSMASSGTPIPVDWTQEVVLELSAQCTLLTTGNSITLESLVVREDRLV